MPLSSSSLQCSSQKCQVFWQLFNLGWWQIKKPKMQKQTITQTHKQTNRQTDRQTDKHTNTQTNRQTDNHTNIQTNRQTITQTNRQTDRQSHKQTDKQTDKQTRKSNKYFWHHYFRVIFPFSAWIVISYFCKLSSFFLSFISVHFYCRGNLDVWVSVIQICPLFRCSVSQLFYLYRSIEVVVWVMTWICHLNNGHILIADACPRLHVRYSNTTCIRLLFLLFPFYVYFFLWPFSLNPFLVRR